MNEQIDFINTDAPVTINHSQDTALDILTEILYRMYIESVGDHGRHIDHAA